jgi:hypothetical protein
LLKDDKRQKKLIASHAENGSKTVLRINKNVKFKIVQFTDIHFGAVHCSNNALKMKTYIYELIGWIGAFSYILAYILLIMKRLSAEKQLYHVLNALGGICLVINAIALHDMPNLIVNFVWMGMNVRCKNWMIVVTTDHGRDAETGKDHGGQSDRERTIWIATNYTAVNAHFSENPAMVDIFPSILRFINIQIPAETEEELDGVPFVGKVSISNFKAEQPKKDSNMIRLSWESLDPEGEAEISVSTTNRFEEGGSDHYQVIGKTNVSKGEFIFDFSQMKSKFYKILIKAPDNQQNFWLVL